MRIWPSVGKTRGARISFSPLSDHAVYQKARKKRTFFRFARKPTTPCGAGTYVRCASASCKNCPLLMRRSRVRVSPPSTDVLPAESGPQILRSQKRKLAKVGLEPTRPCGHWILSPARLPIPPRRLSCRDESLTDFKRNARDSSSSVTERAVLGPADSRTSTIIGQFLPSICVIAHLACSAISASGSAARSRKTGKSSAVPTFPSATQTLRTKRFRLIRRIGE